MKQDMIRCGMDYELPCVDALGCSNSYEVYSRSGGLDYLLCNSCGLIWRDPKVEVRDDIYDKDYQQIYTMRGDQRVKKAHIKLDIIEDHFDIGDLLEIGASTGYFMLAAKNRGWNTKGYDISDFAVQEASRKGLDVSRGSLDDIPADMKYDMVVLNHVLDHFRNPFEALRKLYEVTKEGAGMFIAVPNSRYRTAGRLREMHHNFMKDKGGKEHTVYFNMDNLEKSLGARGFEVVQKDYPVFTGNKDISRTLSRFLRRLPGLVDLNTEIVVLARKGR